jgi:hypothetical protein
MTSHTIKAVVTTCAFVFAAAAYGATPNEGSLHVVAAEDVAGQHLGVGDYTVRWEGNGPVVTLAFVKGARVAATAVAHVTPMRHASMNDSVVIHTDSRGHRTLSQMFFAGKMIALDIPRAS